MGHPAYVSSDDDIGVMASGPHVSEEGREKGRRTETGGNGNIVTTWPHMAETEKGKEGE